MSVKPAYNGCKLCEGYGGWDMKNFQPRFRKTTDTTRTYTPCIWCGVKNVIRKIT